MKSLDESLIRDDVMNVYKVKRTFLTRFLLKKIDITSLLQTIIITCAFRLAQFSHVLTMKLPSDSFVPWSASSRQVNPFHAFADHQIAAAL